MPQIKVLIVDDHLLVADSLSLLLGTIENIDVVGVVSNGWQAITYAQNNELDIILADLHMPLLNGIDMTIRLRELFPKIRVIILTMSEDAQSIRNALQAGIYGYVMKSAEKPELIKALQTVFLGEKYFSEKIVKKLAEIPNENNPNGKTQIEDVMPLTNREIEIVKLIIQDHSNIEIGKKLNIASTTVETHRRNLMKKVGVSTGIGLMRWALGHGLVEK